MEQLKENNFQGNTKPKGNKIVFGIIFNFIKIIQQLKQKL